MTPLATRAAVLVGLDSVLQGAASESFIKSSPTMCLCVSTVGHLHPGGADWGRGKVTIPGIVFFSASV